MKLVSLGVLFDGERGRVESEETVVGWARSMMARRALIILVGLGCDGRAILAAPVCC